MSRTESRPETDAARVRLTLELSQRLNAEVERLAAARQTSKADILRIALEFLSAAESAKSSGMHVGAWRERNGERTSERVFVGI